jgi:hypothetical protein
VYFAKLLMPLVHDLEIKKPLTLVPRTWLFFFREPAVDGGLALQAAAAPDAVAVDGLGMLLQGIRRAEKSAWFVDPALSLTGCRTLT